MMQQLGKQDANKRICPASLKEEADDAIKSFSFLELAGVQLPS